MQCMLTCATTMTHLCVIMKAPRLDLGGPESILGHCRLDCVAKVHGELHVGPPQVHPEGQRLARGYGQSPKEVLAEMVGWVGGASGNYLDGVEGDGSVRIDPEEEDVVKNGVRLGAGACAGK